MNNLYRFSYEWFSFDNEIDKKSSYRDYFITSVGSTFSLVDNYGKLDMYISPNAVGKKITFVTTQSLDFWSIFSLTGGMFATVNSIVAIVAIHIIWGFDWKFLKFGGVATHASPGQVASRQLDAYISRKIQHIEDALQEKDEQIERLYQEIAQLKKTQSIN